MRAGETVRCASTREEFPGAEQEKNTKGIRREYEENTKTYGQQPASNRLAGGLWQAFPSIQPGPLDACGPLTPGSTGGTSPLVQVLQHRAEGREPGHGHAGPGGLPQRF